MSGRTVLVTGGSDGIGKAIAAAFAQAGDTTIVADVAEPVDPAGAGPGVTFVHADVSSAASVNALFAAIADRHARLDVLVNNAGITSASRLDSLGEAEWDRVIDTNLKSVYLCSRAALPLLRRGRDASIVNISSIHALSALPGTAAYAASKAGMNALTRALCLELGTEDIRVNAVMPGFVRTRFWDAWLDGKPAEVRQRIEAEVMATLALKRIGRPEDVAAAVLFLASAAAGYVTGATLLCDGGLSARSYVLPSNG